MRCFIRQSYYDENSVHYDFRIDGIKFCPFCGAYLLGERKLADTVVTDAKTGKSTIFEYGADGSCTKYEDNEMEE
jgi:hypothetical protein